MKYWILSLVLLVFSTGNVWAFPDLSETHSNKEAIDYLVEQGVLKGYADGTFQPDRQVSRAEMIKMLVASQKADTTAFEGVEPCFSDLEAGAWYVPYVCYAQYEGWVSGYPDGTFRPNALVQNVEAVKMLVGAFDLGEDMEMILDLQASSEKPSQVANLDAEAWYAPFVYFLEWRGLEDSMNEFTPGDLYTRADLSELIFRTMVIVQLDELQYFPALKSLFFASK